MTRKMKDSGVEWIGEIPEDWDLCLFKRLTDRIKNGTSLTQIEQSDYRVTRIETISTGSINYEKVGYVNYEEALKNYKLEKGDILFSNINSLEMVGNCAIYEGELPLYSGMNLLRISVNTDNNAKWLYYTIISNYFNRMVKILSNRAINQVSISVGKLQSILCVRPSLEEQKRIAEYLDNKCTKIDQTIEKEKEVIEKLKEYKQSVITEAVTKGLNPDVKMKDSGVEWIGEIPEHWSIVRLKNLGEAIIGLTYSPNEVKDEGILVLRSSNIKNGKIIFSDNVYVDKEKEIKDKLILKKNDILICSRNGSKSLIGKNAIITDDSKGNSFGAFMTVYRSRYNKFIYYVLNSNIFSYHLGTFLTSTINQLTTSNLNSIKIALPAEQEQNQIYDYLDKKCSAIDKLITNKEKVIEKLTEYKKSLIYECVTGKREVQ